jgi:hypothetical protein
MLSAQERKLLSETRDILEELLETEEVLRDKRLMKSIRDSREDARTGRLYTIEELKRKLRREGRLWPCIRTKLLERFAEARKAKHSTHLPDGRTTQERSIPRQEPTRTS